MPLTVCVSPGGLCSGAADERPGGRGQRDGLPAGLQQRQVPPPEPGQHQLHHPRRQLLYRSVRPPRTVPNSQPIQTDLIQQSNQNRATIYALQNRYIIEVTRGFEFIIASRSKQLRKLIPEQRNTGRNTSHYLSFSR